MSTEKMKEDLQPDPQLREHFAVYRNEASMLTQSEIDALLTGRIMLRNSSRIRNKRIVMSLTSLILTAAVIGYFVFGGHIPSNTKVITRRSLVNSASRPEWPSISSADSNNKPEIIAQPTSDSVSQDKPRRGEWLPKVAVEYVTLSDDELAKLGIFNPPNDSVITMCTRHNGKIERFAYNGLASSSGPGASSPAFNAPTFFPVITTLGDGSGCVFRFDDKSEWGFQQIGDDSMFGVMQKWLHQPGQPGLRLFGFSRVMLTDSLGTFDTVFIHIGKNLPAAMWQAKPYGFSEAAEKQIMAAAHFYEGSTSQSPSLPRSISVKADTVDAKAIEKQMSEELNTSTMKRMHAAVEEMNLATLVPVVVRKTNGKDLTKKDFILWYRPTKEFLSLLPTYWRQKLAPKSEPSNAVGPFRKVQPVAGNGFKINRVEISLNEPRKAKVNVRNLLGAVVAESGWESIAETGSINIDTKSLQRGIYLLQVITDHGEQHVERLMISQ